MAYEFIEKPVEASVDYNNIRHYKRTFTLFTDTPGNGGISASSLIGINMYDYYITPYEVDTQAICKNISGNPIDVGIWECVFEYDNEPIKDDKESGEDPGREDDPTARPWQVKIGSNKGTKFVTKDKDNVDVVTSAGTPFDPPLEVECSYLTFNISAWKASFSYSTVMTYQDAINSDAWQGFPPKTLKCIDYTASSQWENGARYWQVDITLEYNPEFWNPVSLLDAGTMMITGSGEPLKPIEVLGQPVSSPVPLNGAGVPLNAGDPLVYLDFKAYSEVAFAGII